MHDQEWNILLNMCHSQVPAMQLPVVFEANEHLPSFCTFGRFTANFSNELQWVCEPSKDLMLEFSHYITCCAQFHQFPLLQISLHARPAFLAETLSVSSQQTQSFQPLDMDFFNVLLKDSKLSRSKSFFQL